MSDSNTQKLNDQRPKRKAATKPTAWAPSLAKQNSSEISSNASQQSYIDSDEKEQQPSGTQGVDKKTRRLLQNRRSAKKCRLKKRNEFDEMK